MKDNQFIRGDNPMTKMEIRSVIIDYLELSIGKNVLEIGAGTGSVTVQMGKSFPHLSITAIEQTESGIALIQQNASAHKVSSIKPLLGKAPHVSLHDHGPFDRVYMGGTGSEFRNIMTWLENGLLADEAILVFSTITLENTHDISAYLFENQKIFPTVEGSQIAASRLESLGRYHYFKPLNPCTVLCAHYVKNRGDYE